MSVPFSKTLPRSTFTRLRVCPCDLWILRVAWKDRSVASSFGPSQLEGKLTSSPKPCEDKERTVSKSLDS